MAATSYLSRYLQDRSGLLALFDPDPGTGTVVDRTGNYTATLQNGATVTSDELVAGAPGAVSLDGTNDYVSTTFGTRRNLITNPRFGGGLLTPWIGASATAAVETDGTAPVGTTVARVTPNTTGSGQGLQIPTTALIDVKASTDYQFSFWIKGASSSHLYVMQLIGYDSGGVAQTTVQYTFTVTGSWQRVTFPRRMTSTEVKFRPFIQTSGTQPNNNPFYVTGFHCEEKVGGITNWEGDPAVTNIDGRTSAAGGNIAAGATLSNTTGGTVGSECIQVATDGTTSSGIRNRNTQMARTFVAGDKVTFSVYLKGAAGGESVTIGAMFNGPADTAVSTVTLTTSWQRFSVTATATAGRTSASWLVRQPAGAARTFYVDGIQLEAGASATTLDSSYPAYFDGSGYLTAETGGTWVPVTDTFRTDLSGMAWTGTAHASTSTYAGRTNAVTNPRGGALATTGWTAYQGTLAAVAGGPLGTVFQHTCNVAGPSQAGLYLSSKPLAVSAGTTYTAQAIPVTVPAGKTPRIEIEWYTSGDVFLSRSIASGGTAGVRMAVTAAAPATAAKADVFVSLTDAVNGNVQEWTGVLFEASSSVNAYFDGSGVVEHQGLTGWLGLEHASASDKGVFANGTTRTFVAVVKRDASADNDAILGGNAVGARPHIRLNSGGTDVAFTPDSTVAGVSWASGGPANGAAGVLAVQFDEPSNAAYMWLNGVAGSQKTTSQQWGVAPVGDLILGARGSAASDPFDGLIGPVAVIDRALTAAEHRMLATIIEQGGPIVTAAGGPVEVALSCEVETATGRRYLWHRDAPTANDRPAVSPSFDTQRGTGFAGGRLTLRRRIDRDWPDLTLGDTVRLIGADGSVAFEGWISALPRTTEGGNAITVELAGFMALAQDEQFRELYVDRDLTRWRAMSAALRLAQLTANIDVHDFSVAADADTGLPALVLTLRGPWLGTRTQVVWVTYDSGGVGVGKVYYDFVANNNVADTNFQWVVRISDRDDHSGTNYTSSDLQAASGSGYYTPSVPLRFANLQHYWQGPPGGSGGSDGVSYEVSWRRLAVYGSHGLTIRGAEPDAGFYVSDLIRNMAARWVPQLDTSGVQDTSYVVRHAAYLQPTYPFDAWQDLNRLHLWELAVWEDKRLVYAPPSSLDEWDWEVRASDPGTSVSLEGDQFPYNGVLVTYTDLLSGVEQTIGPDDYPDDLYDDSDANPATSHGRRRFFPTTVPFPCLEADAVQVGRARFAEAIRAQARGSIATGPTIRDRAGAEHPAWKVRAGDRVVIADLPNDRPRRITSTSWDGRRLSLATDNISRRMEAIFDARVPAARAAAGLG